MSNQDFRAAFLVDQSPEEAVEAFGRVDAWWGPITGSAAAVGDEFSYRVGDVHYSRHRVAELDPSGRVVWDTIDSYLSFVEDHEEWTGTRIVFEAVPRDGGTEVTFTHEGLSTDVPCYDACSTAWLGYVNASLRSLIETGVGMPGAPVAAQ